MSISRRSLPCFVLQFPPRGYIGQFGGARTGGGIRDRAHPPPSHSAENEMLKSDDFSTFRFPYFVLGRRLGPIWMPSRSTPLSQQHLTISFGGGLAGLLHQKETERKNFMQKTIERERDRKRLQPLNCFRIFRREIQLQNIQFLLVECRSTSNNLKVLQLGTSGRHRQRFYLLLLLLLISFKFFCAHMF